MKQFLLPLLLVLSLFGQLAAQGDARWVMAPSGLNLRANSSPSSEKLTTVPFREKVQLFTKGTGPSIVVDNIKAPMAEVGYASYSGYMFEGYLCRFPVPVSNSKTEAYVTQLRMLGFDVPFEEHKFDYDGYYQFHEVFYLPKASWQEAWFIAQGLYDIPESLKFPKPSTHKSETIPNPNKNENSWTDALEIARNSSGELTELKYNLRGEGGGYFISVAPEEKNSSMKITYGLIGD